MKPLSGGNVNQVFRDGDAVVRTAGPWTFTVHSLLRHIRAQGFLLAPEPLGVSDGHERLQFIEGATATDEPWPDWVWTDELLTEVATAARILHETAADFRFDETPIWRMPHLMPTGRSVTICHNDLAPYNIVSQDGHLVGIIDWGLASPGSPLWEIAFMAWQ
jgi:Phosphotransferase enzyme family